MSDNLTKVVKEKGEPTWDIHDEKDYLKMLFEGKEQYTNWLSVHKTPLERLRMYLILAENRDWGGIDAARAIGYAHELIWRLTH